MIRHGAFVLLVMLPAIAPGDEYGVSRSTNIFERPPAKEGFSYPDCYCTDSTGERVELGERACLRIGSRHVTARCAMSLNNPTWRMEGEGCPGV